DPHVGLHVDRVMQASCMVTATEGRSSTAPSATEGADRPARSASRRYRFAGSTRSGSRWQPGLNLTARLESSMTTRSRLMLAAVVGALIGALGPPIGHARQTKEVPGYLIAELEVTDPAGMQRYGERVPETLAPFHHRYLVRGKAQALEGEPPRGVVVIEFD